MTFYSIRDNGKHVGFIRGNLGPACAICRAVADNMCDYRLVNGKRCNKHICEEHSIQVGDDKHHCSDHAGNVVKFMKNIEI